MNNADLLASKVFNFAILSRIVILILIIICGFFPSHINDGFYPPVFTTGLLIKPPSVVDHYLLKFLKGFKQWDSQYFQFISRFGYVTYESLAFFPFTPLLIQLVSALLFWPLNYLIHLDNVNLITGIILNNFAFIYSSVALYKLGVAIFGNCNVAYFAALLYSCNPANVFFSVSYSESLFSLITFTGMTYYVKSAYIKATLMFALSTLVRSNGIINLGFVAFAFLLEFLRQIYFLQLQYSYFNKIKSLTKAIFTLIIPLLFHFAVTLTPFVIYQWMNYKYICEGINFSTYFPTNRLLFYSNVTSSLRQYIQSHGYHAIVNSQQQQQSFSWCNNSVLPIPYVEIQKLWSVGFLGYYQWQKWPAFLLSLPTILIVLTSAKQFLWRMRSSSSKAIWLQQKIDRNTHATLLSIPFLIHSLVLVIFGLLFLNVEIVTRLLFASSPVPIWTAALFLCNGRFAKYSSTFALKETMRYSNIFFDKIKLFQHIDFKEKLMIVFFLGYSYFGTVLHSLGLPWT